MTAELTPQARADLGAFLARLIRLDPAALVRLRPLRSGVTALWARLPFEVLVTRAVAVPLTEDATVRAAELLAVVERGEWALPPRHDLAWRAPLPPAAGEVLEHVPTAEFRRIAQAAASTLRAAVGRGVGERRLRDELLDHVALVVTRGERREEVPVRLVQGLARMGFLGPDDAAPERIRSASGWLGAEATYGTGWLRASTALSLRPIP